MSVIVDASMTLPWYFVDESTARTEQVFDLVINSGAIVPIHWRFEVANGFQMALRRGRIESTYRADSLADLDQLPIEADHESHAQAWADTVRLSDRHNLTNYDAAYLELALRRHLPLATLDRELLLRACGKISRFSDLTPSPRSARPVSDWCARRRGSRRR